LLQRLRRTCRRCVIGESARVGLLCPGGRVMLDIYRAAGRTSGVSFAQVCALFWEIIFGLNGEPPVHDEGDFERRFRVPRSVFLSVYNAVKNLPFFAQRINATGRLQAHPLQKVVAVFRVIAYQEAPIRTDEYVRLSAATIAMSVRELMRFILDEFGRSYLRSPTPEELQRILTQNAERGMPGCIGSLNCSHW